EARKHVANFLGAALRENGHEFVAAKTDGHVGASNGAREALREGAKHFVAGLMAEPIVALLEIIEIQENYGERTRIAARARDFFGEALFAGAAVVQTGERVENSKFVNFLREHLDLRDGVDLIGKLAANAVDEVLLIDGIDAENQNQRDESANSLGQEE